MTAEEEAEEAPTASVLLVALPDAGSATVGYGAEATDSEAEAKVTAEEEAEAPTASVLLVALPDSGSATVGYLPAAASTEATVELVVFSNRPVVRAEASW